MNQEEKLFQFFYDVTDAEDVDRQYKPLSEWVELLGEDLVDELRKPPEVCWRHLMLHREEHYEQLKGFFSTNYVWRSILQDHHILKDWQDVLGPELFPIFFLAVKTHKQEDQMAGL